MLLSLGSEFLLPTAQGDEAKAEKRDQAAAGERTGDGRRSRLAVCSQPEIVERDCIPVVSRNGKSYSKRTEIGRDGGIKEARQFK